MGYETDNEYEKAIRSNASGAIAGARVATKAQPTPIEAVHDTLSRASSLADDVRQMATILCGAVPENAVKQSGEISNSLQTGLLDTLQEHAFAVDRSIEAAYDALQRIRSKLP